MFFLFSEIAAALWVHIQCFEVTLRNFLSESLSTIYNTREWWLVPDLLSAEEISDVRKTLESLEKHQNKINPYSVMEHMGLTFWIKLLGKRYHQKIWMKIWYSSPLIQVGVKTSTTKPARSVTYETPSHTTARSCAAISSAITHISVNSPQYSTQNLHAK